MKNHILTNTFRTIKKSIGCFISLVIMSILGVVVFVGLLATSPDMTMTLDTYLDNYDTYDIKVVSTMGLNKADVWRLEQIEGVEKGQGVYALDLLMVGGEVETVINVSSLPEDINKLEVLEGRLPQQEDEMVIEENFLSKMGYQINDKVVLDDDNLVSKEFVIVGSVRSSLYFNNTKVNQNRGPTTVGSGNINYYAYMMDSSFKQDYYTYIYLVVSGSKGLVTSRDSYVDMIGDVVDRINGVKGELESNRYQVIYDDAKEEIESYEKKANEELDRASKELSDVKSKLDKAKRTLDNTKSELDKAKRELDRAKQDIDKGKKSLSDSLKTYGITDIDDSINSVSDNISKLEKDISKLDANTLEYQEVKGQLDSLKQNMRLLEELKGNKVMLDNSQNEYDKGYKEYNDGYVKYQDGLYTYKSNLKNYNSSYIEYEENKSKVEREIKDAYEELADLDRPKVYVYDRSDNQTYASYVNQANSIKNLASLFPIVFYGVAILVSLVSMNRMVEDDRGEIGTLKSLGFSNNDIRKKYVIFSLAATLCGALIGAIIGLTAIPYLIFAIYRLLFDIPIFVFNLNILYTLEGILIAIFCICGSSVITSNKILKEKTAILMRPAPPKSGKKILLENIKFIWKRLKFSDKVTIRNIFRYKKRVFVIIFGICGCTALMLCGFGIKDSIVDITNMQYVRTFVYEFSVYTKGFEDEKIDELVEGLPIIDTSMGEVITGTYKESSVNMLVMDSNDSLNKIANLEDRDGEIVYLEDGDVIVTDKLADLYNIGIGDEIKILDGEQKEYVMMVTKIVKNYMGHYIYMSKDSFLKMGYVYKGNVLYMNTDELSCDDKDRITNKLLGNDKVLSVVHIDTMVDSANDMLESLNKVIVVLVVLSACLSFVVLYNLSNINIRERKREIATLKVLGFYDKEVDSYITKEMVILTIVGIILGLGFGYLLTNMVIATVEMENARFIRHVKIDSYVYASAIAVFFTFLVNYVTHFILKKIDMIESLKSVE